MYFPTVSLAPSATYSRGAGVFTGPNTGTTVVTPGTTTTGTTTVATGGGGARVQFYSLPGEASWAPDLFGRVRNTVRQRQYNAQVQAANVENTRLLQQALLVQTLFELRGQDALATVLNDTVAANAEIVRLTEASYKLGISSEAEVLQARLTLQTARVQATNVGIARAQLEHAIATLVGEPASSFSLPHRELVANPPVIPIGTPSQLLERRPDIAAAERAMAAANATIGIGYAAYFPLLTLTANLGVASRSIETLLSWPSRVWALGANISQLVFDGGQRRAVIDEAIATYDAAIAAYRQTVLTAFQQVEDQLAQLRVLAIAIEQQKEAVQIAERSFEVERARYQTGLDPYVTLMTQQTALLEARQTLITLQVQQMTAAVLLIQSLGGGWTTADLPSTDEVTRVRPRR